MKVLITITGTNYDALNTIVNDLKELKHDAKLYVGKPTKVIVKTDDTNISLITLVSLDYNANVNITKLP